MRVEGGPEREELRRRLAALGAAVPGLLLPREGIDLSRWAVIACDQFTQDRAYWDRLEAQGAFPSSLRLIYPEVYLEDRDRGERIAAIHRTMEDYLSGGIFGEPLKGFVYIERDTPFQKGRRGLLICLDLEQYDWRPESSLLTRATEGTVTERIPPRMEVRRGAALELPHILLLINDGENKLLPALGERAKAGRALYDTELRPDSGRVRGWLLEGEADWEFLAAGLEALARRAGHGQGGISPDAEGGAFLYAVGDGNHSLAAAKAVWEEYKQAHRGEKDLERHPARWALAELENLYDPALTFEPIHRVIFGAEPEEILAALGELPGFTCGALRDRAELERLLENPVPGKNRYGLAAGSRYILVEAAVPGIATGPLQPVLDRFTAAGKDRTIDYIHGADSCFRLARSEKTTAILLPPVKKEDLFLTVAQSGPLPRKSFSMGEAEEKRFYLECRRLFVPRGA
ncbi:MAG: DUF1015 domain-containing protein [Treponema sp.]|nr:DUF1015 domain-containing protein [Treponema sp.]